MTPALRCPVTSCDEPIRSSRIVGMRVYFTCRDNHTYMMASETLVRLAAIRRLAATTEPPPRETDEELTQRIRRVLG